MLQKLKRGGRRKGALLSLIVVLALSLTVSLVAFAMQERSGAVAETFRNEQIDGILRRVKDIDTFENDGALNSWSKDGAVSDIAVVNKIQNGGYVAQGKKCLEITRDGVSAVTTEAIVKRSFESPLDLSDSPILAFAVNSFGGLPDGNKYFVTVTARNGNREFSSKFIFAPNVWNTLTMNFKDCDFKNEIRELEFKFGNNSGADKIAWAARMQLDHIFAGRVIDLKFGETGNTQGFTATGAELTAEDDALKVQIASGTNFALKAPWRPIIRASECFTAT